MFSLRGCLLEWPKPRGWWNCLGFYVCLTLSFVNHKSANGTIWMSCTRSFLYWLHITIWFAVDSRLHVGSGPFGEKYLKRAPALNFVVFIYSFFLSLFCCLWVLGFWGCDGFGVLVCSSKMNGNSWDIYENQWNCWKSIRNQRNLWHIAENS